MTEEKVFDEFMFLFTITFIIIPLLWTWTRSALAILDWLRNDVLQNPSSWLHLLNIIPAYSFGMLLGLFAVTLARLSRIRPLSIVVLSEMTFVVLLFPGLLYLVYVVWRTINTEVVTILDRLGL